MKYIYNKGLTLSVREWLLILTLVAILTMFGLIVTNNKLGVELLQTIIAGKA